MLKSEEESTSTVNYGKANKTPQYVAALAGKTMHLHF